MFQGVLFDLDGTLINRRQAFESYCLFLLQNYFPARAVNYTEKLLPQLKQLDRQYAYDRYLFFEKLVELYHITTVTPRQLYSRWINEFTQFVTPMDGMLETLKYLKQKYTLGLITNGDAILQRAKVDCAGIKSYFSSIIISEEAGVEKPDKKIFSMCCRQLGLAKEKCIFIGDNYYADILGALNAGLESIWIIPDVRAAKIGKITHVPSLWDLQRVL